MPAGEAGAAVTPLLCMPDAALAARGRLRSFAVAILQAVGLGNGGGGVCVYIRIITQLNNNPFFVHLPQAPSVLHWRRSVCGARPGRGAPQGRRRCPQRKG
uniref:Uncharacterized protein n=1 Tax=uncultured prokaryote TaxID=198431 RepID=A0A0H5QCS6_9ZZZZ|nr:hypothetical protein [uncultured prokaryote]